VVVENEAVGGGPTGVATDYASPSKFVFVTSETSKQVRSFTITSTTGAINLQDTENVGGARGVAVNAAGTFLYVASSGSNAIHAFSIDSNGNLSQIDEETGVGSEPTGIAVPVTAQTGTSDLFLFVTNEGDDQVKSFKIGSDGRLSGATSTASTGDSPRDVVVDKTASRIFVANNGGNTVSVFNVSTSGSLSLNTTLSLTKTSGSSSTDGTGPIGLGMSPVTSNFFYVANNTSNNVSAFTISGVAAGGAIPTLSEWGLIILALLLFTFAVWKLNGGRLLRPAP